MRIVIYLSTYLPLTLTMTANPGLAWGNEYQGPLGKKAGKTRVRTGTSWDQPFSVQTLHEACD